MDILSDKIVTTRKKHVCDPCGRVFKKGTKMRTQVNTYDGIGTWRECPTCRELLIKFSESFADDYENVVTEGCVHEVMCDYPNIKTPEELLKFLTNSSENPDTKPKKLK